ncbi:MAG: GAF domain-containing protein [Deltaproteobacteria bacterium]|nr:GAF domain-containing protein [Deltaproteobacteria bacterium]
MAPKGAKLEGLEKHYEDLIDVARLLSRSLDKDIIIRRALEHVNERLGKRARYAVLEDGRLMIKYWIGDYKEDLHTSKKIVKRSIVWEVFEEGRALNLTDPSQTNGYEHTLKERVKIKAVVPLKYVDARTQQEVKFGVLVVDSGREQTPIAEEEFDYLLIMADLIGETVGKAELVNELIRSYEDREEIVKSMAHFLRNRFMVIGGFARRLHKKANKNETKGYAEIIFKGIGEMETCLQDLEEMWKEEKERQEEVRRWKDEYGKI